MTPSVSQAIRVKDVPGGVYPSGALSPAMSATSPDAALPAKAALDAVRGVTNPGPTLMAPGVGKVTRVADVAAEDSESFVQDQRLLGSPALLADYTAWVRDFDALGQRDSAQRAYRELTFMLFDREIERPWGDRYFPELNRKLADFRRHFCSGDAPACRLPQEVHDDAGLKAIADVLLDPQVIETMRARYGFNVHPVRFVNSPRAFDLMISRRAEQDRDTVQYWGMQPAEVAFTNTTPVQRGADGYRAGFENGVSFAGHFGMGRDGVLIDDWLVRDRAMAFAHAWKITLELARDYPRDNPIAATAELQFTKMRDDHRAELDATYDRLLPLVASKPEVQARFERERALGDYPEEVYQHVAYTHLLNMVRIESGFYALAQNQRPGTSDRQLALEAMLTMQRYEPAWRFFLMDLTTQSVPLGARAAVIDQVSDPLLAFTFAAEQLKAILGMEVYGDDNLYERLSYAVLADELFDARYLREYQPAIHQELLQADGSLRRVSDLPRADQIRILRSYLVNAQGQLNMTGVVRMRAVFAGRVKEEDLRLLADTIHGRRLSGT